MAFWKKLGRFALKAVPIAAMAIPGIGPLASAAIQGGISAAQTKAAGGSWRQALKSGLVSGGAAYAGGKLPGKLGLKPGIGPSKGFLAGAKAGLAGGTTSGFTGRLGSALAKNALQGGLTAGIGAGVNKMPGLRDQYQDQGIGPSSAMMQRRNPAYAGGQMGGPPQYAVDDMSSPNLWSQWMQGRNEALQNQPWRNAAQNTGPNPLNIYPQQLQGYGY